jgi:hypothetical protein
MRQSNLERPVFFPRGVATPGGDIGCTAHAEGIFGVDLAMGHLQWQTRVASWPLIILGDKLCAGSVAPAQHNVLHILVLDLSCDAEVTDGEAEVVFPAWVDLSDADAFQMQTYKADDDVVLEWEAHRRYRGGAPPSEEILRATTLDTCGVARIHLAEGSVDMSIGETISGRAWQNDVEDLNSLPYEIGFQNRADPWLLDEHLFGLAVEDRGRERWLCLRSNKPDLRSVELMQLPTHEDVQPRLTRDGRFVLVRTEGTGEQASQSGPACQIFRTDTGRRVARVKMELDARDPCILDTRLYYVTGTALMAKDLSDAEQKWAWPLPPATFRGPPPLRR